MKNLSNVTETLDVPTKEYIVNNCINNGDIILKENYFYQNKKIYISKIDNAFYLADKRYTTTFKIYNNDDTLYMDVSNSAYNVFNGTYEAGVSIPVDKYAIISIVLDSDFLFVSNQKTIFSFYNYNVPADVTGRVRARDNTEEYQWYNLSNIGNVSKDGYEVIVLKHVAHYNVIEYEFKITAKSDIMTTLVQIESSMDRIGSNISFPVVLKYSPQTLYYPLTLPGNPTDEKHAATKGYVDDNIEILDKDFAKELEKYLKLTGGEMFGDIEMSLNPGEDARRIEINGLILNGSGEMKNVSSDYPIMLINNANSANRALAVGLASDSQNVIGIIFSNDSIFNSLLGCENGINFTYNLNMMSNRIRKVADPIENNDAVNKKFVDSKIVGLTEDEYNNLQTKQQGVLYCIYEE